MHPILFKFGPITVYTYGVFVFLGVLAGYFASGKQAEHDGIDKEIFSSILFWVLVSGFVGARIFYVFVNLEQLLANPLSVILTRSGFVFYGGVIFGLLSLYLFTRNHKINFLKFTDTIAPGLALGHAFGRLGCFFHGCCYGEVWIFPVQLVSSFFLLLIFFVLLFLKKRRKFQGQISLYYIIFYGTFRFIIEFFRNDPRGEVLFLSTSQFISLILVIAAFLSFWYNAKHD